MKQFIRLLLAMGVVSAVVACDAASDFGAGYDFSGTGKSATEAYPNLPVFEAQRRYAQDQYEVIAAKQTTVEEKREVAAAFYAGFALYNARAIPAYCKRMNLYPTKFVESFRKLNIEEEKALDRVLALRKTTQDQLWEDRERKMMSRAKKNLMGGNLGPGSYSTCANIKDTPGLFLERTHFQKQFPKVAMALTR